MGEKPHGAVSMVSMHHSMLASVLGRLKNLATMINNYNTMSIHPKRLNFLPVVLHLQKSR